MIEERIIILQNKKFSIEDEILELENNLLKSIIIDESKKKPFLGNMELFNIGDRVLKGRLELNHEWKRLKKMAAMVDQDILLVESESYAVDGIYSLMKI